MNEPMLDSSSRLLVNGSGVTQPVSLTSTTISGTVAVTESGTWNVGLNAGTNAIGSITNTSFGATQATAASLNATVVGTGTFAVQATQAGTWNIGTLTSITNALPAGSNLLGKVGIDQTTPGTTNAVSVTNSTLAVTQSGTWNIGLSAGANLVGKVGIDQTIPGTTNNVSISGSTGAGTSNLIKDDTQFGDAVTTGVVSAAPRLYNGSTYDRWRSAAGVTGVGAVGGLTASGSSVAAAPVTTGGLAKTANPTAVADGQVVNRLHDKLGKQVVVGSIRDLKANQVTTITASTAETTIVTAVASTFLDMYGLIITNTSATAVNVAIKDATAGTTRLNIAVPAGDTRGFMLPEGGAIKQAAVNGNWTATSSGSVSSLVITALTVQNL